MAVFHVEETKGFTIMSNHHLRNTKAKGLLSLMPSLLKDWDYTAKGIAHICKDGVDSITTDLKEDILPDSASGMRTGSSAILNIRSIKSP